MGATVILGGLTFIPMGVDPDGAAGLLTPTTGVFVSIIIAWLPSGPASSTAFPGCDTGEHPTRMAKKQIIADKNFI